MKISERKEHIAVLNGRENLVILQISDIHLWYSTSILEKLDSLIKENNPDIIFMTGDYYDVPKGAYNFRRFLIQVARRYLIIFIRGNHDIMYGSKISNLLMGIPQCFCVEDLVFRYKSRRGHHYNITSWQNRASLPKVKNGIHIVLIHNPEKINENELANIDIILAGHLHGSQFIFFKTKKNSHFPGNLLYKYCTDRKQIANTTLLISKGLGDTLPIRVNCPREVVKLIIN